MIHPVPLSALFALIFASLGVAENPTLRVTAPTGDTIQPAEFLEQGTVINIACNWVLTDPQSLFIWYYNTSDNQDAGVDSTYLAACSSQPGQNPTKYDDAPNDTTCDTSGIRVAYTLEAVTPYSFFCKNDPAFSATVSSRSDYFLAPKSYVRPIVPTIHSPPRGLTGMTEYSNQVFVCSSEGRPPPKMQLRLGGQLQPVTHHPSVDSIHENSPFGMSNATWNVNVTRHMNGIALVCSMEHESQVSFSKSIDLAVLYGPDNDTTVAEKTYNLEEGGEQIEIECGLTSNPPASVKWYKNDVSTTPLNSVENDNLIIRLADYPTLVKGMVETTQYICKAEANNRNAFQTISVTLTRMDITTTTIPTTAERTTVAKPSTGPLLVAGLNWWVWLIVGIIALLILISLIVISVICYKRRATSSPVKEKKIEKNRIAKESENKAGPGLSGAQSDIIRNSYSGDTGRYSQNYDDWNKTGTLDLNPRSRRPIALDELGDLDGPVLDDGPPAYNGQEYYPATTYSSADPQQYNNTYQPHESYMGYGAPC